MDVSIDTLQIVTRLPWDTVVAMQDSIRFHKGNKYFKSMKMNAKGEPFYVMYYQPTEIYVRPHYNVMLLMKNETLRNMPDDVKKLIRLTTDWKPKRMDIAFDYDTPIGHSMPIVNGNAKVTRYNNGYYLYSSTSEVQACVYNKANEQQRKGIETVGDWTRIEIRLRPTLKESSLYDMQWAEPLLNKIIWMPDIGQLDITKQQKDILRKIQRRKDFNWKRISSKQKEILRLAVEGQRIDFWGIFNNNKEQLMQWIWNAYCEPLSEQAIQEVASKNIIYQKL